MPHLEFCSGVTSISSFNEFVEEGTEEDFVPEDTEEFVGAWVISGLVLMVSLKGGDAPAPDPPSTLPSSIICLICS